MNAHSDGKPSLGSKQKRGSIEGEGVLMIINLRAKSVRNVAKATL
jgi:hypothetical protein